MEHILEFNEFIIERYGRSGHSSMYKDNAKTEFGTSIIKFVDSYFRGTNDNSTVSTVKSYIYDIIEAEVNDELNVVDLDDWDDKAFDDFLIRLINVVEDGERIVASKIEDYLADLNAQDVEDTVVDLERDLERAERERKEMDDDMDIDAGSVIAQGKEWTDADGNRWGAEMNVADEKIDSLKAEIQKIKSEGLDPKVIKNLQKVTKKEVNSAIKLINKI